MKRKIFNVALKKVASANNAVDNDLEIYFLDLLYNNVQFDWYTGELEEDNIVANVIAQVKTANPSRIICYIDSQGGDANIGLALYNFLKSYNAKVEVQILGMAGSIASVLAMAANKGKLSMARNSFMVIHKAWGAGVGNSTDLRQTADMLDLYTAQICDIYSQRSGKTVDEIQALIAEGDYWMTGTEAKEMGFCDSLLNDNSQFQIAARVKTLDPNYKNIPQNLLEEINPIVEEPTIKEFLKDQFMEIKTLVSNFIASLKTPKAKEGETTPPPVSNEVVNVANSIEAPLNEFLTNVQAQIKEEVKNEVAAQLPTVQAFKDLQTENANLKTELETVKNQIEEKESGESKETKTPAANAKPVLVADSE